VLKASKAQCDVLVVALQTDPTLNTDYRMDTDGKHKNTPIESFNERKGQLEGGIYTGYELSNIKIY